jgi:ABC-type uncharacterized transport system involved in gliding motility auxiliary subunit
MPMSNQARRWLLLVAATAGFAGTLVMLELILSHHNWRIDLTPERRFTLSDHARKLLAEIDQDVEVIAFLRSDDDRNSEVEDLLKRVHNVSRHVRYSVIDVNRNPAVARQYGVDRYGSLVVESNGRRQDVTGAREDLLMAAILQTTRPARKVVYFLTGHGEADLDSSDRHKGYSSARTALQHEFYDVQPLSLLGGHDVAADAAAVVVAEPRQDLLPTELTKLDAYTARGGGLLILLGADALPALRVLLETYGVRLDDGVIVDPENRLFAGDYLTITVPGLSAEHPVSAAARALPLFSQARAVSFVGTDPHVKGIEFMHTAPSSWRTPDAEVLRTGTATFTDGRDQPGPVSVGVSLMITTPGTEASAIPPARLIILGNCNFADNFFIEYLGNKDLLVNSVNWLAGEQALVGQRLPQRTAGINQFFVSAQQGRLALILGTIVEPLVVLAIGAAVFWRRRRGE